MRGWRGNSSANQFVNNSDLDTYVVLVAAGPPRERVRERKRDFKQILLKFFYFLSLQLFYFQPLSTGKSIIDANIGILIG